MKTPERQAFEDALHLAAVKYDGHVTNGSFAAQLKVIDDYILASVFDEGKKEG